jgi:hypothetical protein
MLMHDQVPDAVVSVWLASMVPQVTTALLSLQIIIYHCLLTIVYTMMSTLDNSWFDGKPTLSLPEVKIAVPSLWLQMSNRLISKNSK